MKKILDHYLLKFRKRHLVERIKNKDELPKNIKIDACTICQLNCIDCYMRKNPELVKKGCKLGFLSFKNFKKIVNENEFESIELSNGGEIFLNPELEQIIEYAHLKKIRLTAFSGVNLNTLSDKMAEALVKYKFRELVVSIDGASQEIYSKYRIGGTYNNVVDNIKKIQNYKKKYQSKYPIIKWKFIVFKHNTQEIDKAKEKANELDIEIFFARNWEGDYSKFENLKLLESKTNLNLRSNELEDLINKCKTDKTNWLYCHELWKMPQVNWDGQMLGCCLLFGKNFGGNVFKDGLIKALNHPKLIYAKNMIKGNARIARGVPCVNCECFKKMQELDYKISSEINKNNKS